MQFVDASNGRQQSYTRPLIVFLVVLGVLIVARDAEAAIYGWTDRTAAGSRNWSSITSSSDGTKLTAAVANGDIYTSTDSGATWTDQTASGLRTWNSVTSSSDGTKLAGAASGEDIYTSTDSGATWTDQTASGARSWSSITSSSDGTKLAAVANGGDIYTSTDSGANWTDRTAAGARSWKSITSSSDGTKLAAVVNGGDIYTSTDSGSTWTDRAAAGTRNWFSITSSSDGTKLAAVVDTSGDIYISTDSGATWTDQTAAGSRNWSSITSSFDGTKLAAAVGNGDIYTGVANVPNAPTNLRVQSVSGSAVTLAWDIPSGNGNGIIAYNIYRGIQLSPVTLYFSQTSGTSSATYTDTAAAGSTPFYYRVSAQNDFGESGYSNQISGLGGSVGRIIRLLGRVRIRGGTRLR